MQTPEQCLLGLAPSQQESGLQTSGPPTDLVGKEQMAHGLIIRVLHDGTDHLQHWGDSCNTATPHTPRERLLHTRRPSARQMPRAARTTGSGSLTLGSSQSLVICATSHTLALNHDVRPLGTQ